MVLWFLKYAVLHAVVFHKLVTEPNCRLFCVTGNENLLPLQIELVEQPFDREKNIKKGFCFITFETGDPVDVICVNQKHHVGGRDVSTPTALTPLSYLSIDFCIRLLLL